jgi:hypothetical protein
MNTPVKPAGLQPAPCRTRSADILSAVPQACSLQGSAWSVSRALVPRGILACVLLILLASASTPSVRAAGPEVNVILWFDTEDYLLPADDDACLRLAQLLSERHIRATFKVVGEKARVLQSRGRKDVITALRKHDIGYHANFHSVHPTPSEYLANSGLLDGMAEFVRREGGGAADVRRVFGVKRLACYGQPGSSWAAQAVAALSQIGVAPHDVQCYVDEGENVGLDQKPFWYANTLNVYHMGRNYTRMELHDPAAVAPAKAKVSDMVSRLLAEDQGGLISIFYHPCEWVHVEFWDGVNFRRGANPPREQWKPPGQLPPEQTDAAFLRFAEYIDHIRSIPQVQFVTASDLPLIYPDPVRSRGTSEAELKDLTANLVRPDSSGVEFQRVGRHAYSVADQFELLTLAVGGLINGTGPSFPLKATGVLGPDSVPPKSEKRHLDWPAFRDTTRDVLNFVQTQHRVPARVFVGPDPVPPADFLVALARGYNFYLANGRLPLTEGVDLPENVELLSTRYIAPDTPGLFGGWIIHKEGFRAPKIVEIARLQAWTLKPALPGP